MKAIWIGFLVAGAAAADVVTDWNAIMLRTVSAEAPPVQTRFAAITQLAMAEAVTAITRDYEPYLPGLAAPASASPDAAAVAAAHRVLVTYFPGSAAALDAERTASLSAVPDGAAKNAGIAAGEAAAAAMVALRASDGAGVPIPYTPMNGIGYWQPTPPGFAPAAFLHWGKLPPLAMQSADQFRSKQPPALTSGLYARDYNEVKAVGGASSTVRTPEQSDLARLMAMTGPVALWNPVAVQVSAAQGRSLSENARIFALLNIAMFDASIAVFDSKYHYHYWRPVTAIHAGDMDGNAHTAPDAAFTTFLPSPPYPSYPSGHGTVSNAGRVMLELLLGRAGHSITLSNPNLPGVIRQYSWFRRITDDIADARIFAGIHYRFDQESSEVQGHAVAQYIQMRYLRCVRPNGCGDAE